MLNLYLGPAFIFMENKISKVSDYFDAVYKPSWFESAEAREIIKKIDDSEYYRDEVIISPVFGAIPPRMLSSGCKALLLLLNRPELIVSGDRMGDNCYPVLLEMARKRDYTITLCHWVRGLEACEPLGMYDIIAKKEINTAKELLKAYCFSDDYTAETSTSVKGEALLEIESAAQQVDERME